MHGNGEARGTLFGRRRPAAFAADYCAHLQLRRISKMMKKRGFSSYTSAVTSRMGASATKTSTKLSSAPDGEPTSGASGAASYTSEEPN